MSSLIERMLAGVQDDAVDRFGQELSRSRPESEVSIAAEIIDWTLTRGLDPSYQPAKRQLNFRSPANGRQVFSLLASGDFFLQLRWILAALPFSDPRVGNELVHRLEHAVTVWRPDRSPSDRGFPDIPLSSLDDRTVRTALLNEVDWILDGLTNISPEAILKSGQRAGTKPPAPLSTPYLSPPSPQYSSPAEILVDLANRERMSQEHWQLQEWLADALGKDPEAQALRPDPRVDPPFDLAWYRQGQHFIAEVKTLPAGSELQQLRLGIGQVLDYQQRYLDEHGIRCQAVLFVSHKPERQSWASLCERVGITLCWPETMEREIFTNV